MWTVLLFQFIERNGVGLPYNCKSIPLLSKTTFCLHDKRNKSFLETLYPSLYYWIHLITFAKNQLVENNLIANKLTRHWLALIVYIFLIMYAQFSYPNWVSELHIAAVSYSALFSLCISISLFRTFISSRLE